MGRKKIKPVDLSKAVAEVLNEYGDKVYEVLPQAVEEVSDKAVKQLHDVQNFAPNGHPTGKYSASWDVKTVFKDRLHDSLVIYNAEHYRLTHLLENGHAKRGGGRVPAYPHIAPVNDWVNEELPRVVAEKLEGI